MIDHIFASRVKNRLSFIFCLFLFSSSTIAKTIYNEKILNDLDLETTTLPRNFKGNSFLLLQDEWHKKFLQIKQKSKFESEADFNSRLNRERDSVVEESLPRAAYKKYILTFVFDPKFEYDAEKKGFYASHTLDNNYIFGGESLYSDKDDTFSIGLINNLQPFWRITFLEKKRITGSYLVVNSFGAQFKVEKNEYFRRDLYITACKLDENVQDRYLPFGTFIPASGEYAKSLDGNLRYLLIMKEFTPPYIRSTRFRTSPDMRYGMEDSVVNIMDSFGKLSNLWVFNNKTGEVIKKYNSCEIKSTKENIKNLFLF